jgi:hypothetical protein
MHPLPQRHLICFIVNTRLSQPENTVRDATVGRREQETALIAYGLHTKRKKSGGETGIKMACVYN